MRLHMVRTRRRVATTLLIWVASVFAASSALAAQRERNRARSIYVPVRFEACEHVRNVRLTIAGDPQAFTPGKRIFMFTYYPELDAVLPELAEVWIEGEATTEEGSRPIRTNLLVTPERIASSRDELDRGPSEIVKQLRRRMDVRLPETLIHIKCEDSCTRWVPSSDDSDDSEGRDDPESAR